MRHDTLAPTMRVSGKWLYSGDERVLLRGVTYGTFDASLEDGVPSAARVEQDCHPAAAVDFESSYGVERATELRALCDPVVRGALDEHGVELCSFRDIVRR